MIDDPSAAHDIVISSRIRLVRNLADYPFVCACSQDQLQEIDTLVRYHLAAAEDFADITFGDRSELDLLEKQFLADLDAIRQSVSRPEPVVSRPTIDVGLNGEDHLTIESTRGGDQLQAAWKRADQLDNRLQDRLSFAFSRRWGFLTSSPADVGTGLRAAVFVHLPALSLMGKVDRLARQFAHRNITIRNLGVDSAVTPDDDLETGRLDLFRVGNQATLGVDEAGILNQVDAAVGKLVQEELEQRQWLLEQEPGRLQRAADNAVRDLDTNGGNEDLHPMFVVSRLLRVRWAAGAGLVSPEQADRVANRFSLARRKKQLLAAVAEEEYRKAAVLRDQIRVLQTQLDWQGESP